MEPYFNKKKYSKEKSWAIKNNIKNCLFDESWNDMFLKLFEDKRFQIIQNKINNFVETNENVDILYPKPNYIFKTFCMVPLENVKVVIIGQDPYFNHEFYKDRLCPQAYGLSFSVPVGVSVPSSLENIYKNLYHFKHIDKIPNHGCLDYWAYQGCLMLNSALTVIDGQKNCHQNDWKWFTDKIIEYISEKKEKVVFVLWGGEAYKKINLIDLDKHEVVISSHPSGLSAHQQFKSYSSFNNQDHFGLINSYLKEKIDWVLPDY
jgi:uracil-DNA glycosylase